MDTNKKTGAVLITGAADRIGLEIAKECRALGYGVIIHYRSSDEPAKTFFKDDGDVSFIQADLTDDGSMRRLFDEAAKLPVTLAGLINNAATFQPGDMSATKHFRDILENNALAPMEISARFAEIINDGWIINMTDARIRPLNKKYQNYRVSKIMLEEITRQQAFLYAPRIRVNAIAPGLILPPSNAGANELTNSIPMQRTGNTQNIRQAVRFLIENEYMTGAVIPIDGGWGTLTMPM